MPDTRYSGDANGTPSPQLHCATELVPASKYFDGHVSIEVETDPHIHAQKLHALLAGLDAIHDSEEEFGDKEKSDIVSWLLYMARSESAAMMKSFAKAVARKASQG